MKTRIPALLGIERRIVQGEMHFVGLAQLTAAVSDAGGLGMITGLTQKTPKLLGEEISRTKTLTPKSFWRKPHVLVEFIEAC